ncbi:MAG TPA: trehalose-phosphatase [Caulobacteraceae bacterium]
MPESLSVLEREPASAPPAIDPAHTALFLDLDGTLAGIEAHPDHVVASPERTRVIREAARRLDGRLAVVSGRSLGDLDRILERAVPAAAAVHGLVRRNAAGAVMTRAPHPGVNTARVMLDRLADRPGIMIEDKMLGLAIHYRGAPEREAEVIDIARRTAATTGLVLQLGSMVAELRTPGADKGASVRAFMSEAPFAGATPVFVGDDLTDEDGFAAAAELGGHGVLVGPGRESAAHYRLEDVEAVLAWLSA